MKLVISSAQHIGSRGQQQDAYIVPDCDEAFLSHAGRLVLVADGMGGLAHGELASRVAADAFVRAWHEKTADESISDALVRAVEAANRTVFETAQEKDAAGDMGTTLVAGVFREDSDGATSLTWISVGDSGIFVISRDKLAQLNIPHTLATFLQEQVQKGLIAAEVADNHPERESLISFLGLEKIALIDCCKKPVRLECGDVVLFASDGLFKFLAPEIIQKTIRGDARYFGDRLVETTIGAAMPHQDNVTVVSVSCGASPKRTTSVFASLALVASAVAGGFLWNRVRRKSSTEVERADSVTGN